MSTPTIDTELKPFEPGTTGWSADDLDDPVIERLWDAGAYEIVEGVLAKMPPAYLDSSRPLQRLIRLIERHLEATGQPGEFGPEADYVISKPRVARVDAVFMTPQDDERQRRAHARFGRRKDLELGRLLVPPTLIIESISPGHEAHDRELKRGWYAEAGVPNYWLFDAYQRSLVCLVLDKRRGVYRTDASGKGDANVKPAPFPGLVIPLKKVWR